MEIVILYVAYQLAFFPRTNLAPAILRYHDSFSMLSPILPVALITLSIRPIKHTKTSLFIMLVLTIIAFSISPNIFPPPMHLVLVPKTIVWLHYMQLYPSIWPNILPKTVDHVILPVPSVNATLMPFVAALPTLPPIPEISLIYRTIWPCLNTITMRLVVLELALIDGTLQIIVSSASIHSIVYEFTLIVIAVRQPKLSIPICFVVYNSTFISWCVLKDQLLLFECLWDFVFFFLRHNPLKLQNISLHCFA